MKRIDIYRDVVAGNRDVAWLFGMATTRCLNMKAGAILNLRISGKAVDCENIAFNGYHIIAVLLFRAIQSRQPFIS